MPSPDRRDGKMELLTMLYLMEFRQLSVLEHDEGPVDIKAGMDGVILSLQLKISEDIEINVQVSTTDVPVWVINYRGSDADLSSENTSLWRVAVVYDDVFKDFAEAQDTIAQLVDHLMEAKESPTSLSNLEMANPLTTD